MSNRSLSVFTVALLALVMAPTADAATFYVDPVTGSMSGDGSLARPWRTLEEVFSRGLIRSKNSSGNTINPNGPVWAGDTILLRSGYHGDINVSGYYNDDLITVEADSGHTPAVRRLYVSGFKNWCFSGLAVSTQLSPSFAKLSSGLVSISGTSSYVTVQNCLVYSVADITGYTAADWLNNTSNGIGVSSTSHHVTILDNVVRNTGFGISISGTDTLVRGNQVVNFRGDGIRALNDNLTIEYNTVKNAFKVDDNHDDGIQVFKTSVSQGLIRNMVLRGNTIINAEDPAQPLQTTLQGIGIFEGPHENFRIENNLVITNHWHGITLYWGRNCTVINNTVYNPRWISGQSTLRTWIEIGPAKSAYGGELSQNCRIANNIAHTFRTAGNVNLIYQNNLVVDLSNYASVFVAPQNGDFRLKTGSPAIDAGSSVDAPPFDILRNPRPTGSGWDLGAHELQGAPGPPAPPVAYAGPDRTVADADQDGWQTVVLDGSGSYCSGGSITSWTWTENAAVIATGPTPSVALPVGVHLITLTVTNNDTPPKAASDTVIITVSRTAPVLSSALWQNFPIAEQTGAFTFEFDAQPNGDAIDGVLGLCDGPAASYTNLAPIFRFNTSGRMDVRNGSAYTADVVAPYASGTWYHVRMAVDVPSRRYSVYVTPFGGQEFTLAANYAFRSEQSSVSRLNQWALVHTGGGGGFTVKDAAVATPLPLAVAAWEVVADHGPAGAVATPVADDGIEPRLPGLRTFRITFTKPVDPATVQPGAVTIAGMAGGDASGRIQSLTLDPARTVLTVALSSPLPDADTYTAAVTGAVRAADGTPLTGDADLVIHALAGDVDGSGDVTAADVLAVRAAIGWPLTPDTAAYDLNASGAITSADLQAARSRLGNALP